MDSGLFRAVKAFIMKESFDFTRPDIELYNFHPQLRLFIAPMGIFYNNQNSLLRFVHHRQPSPDGNLHLASSPNTPFTRFVWPFISVSLSIIAIVLEIMFVLRGISIEDYSFATECFCYFIMLGVIPMVYGSMLFNRSNVLKIIDDMNKDFKYICQLEGRYRDHFLKGQLLIWQLCFIWLWFFCGIVSMYLLTTLIPLLYLSLFATQDEHMIRPLMFPMWLPEDDPYRTPNYEIFLCLQLIFCFIFLQTFAVYVYIQFHLMLHNYYLLEMVIFDFDVIFDGLDETVAVLPKHDPRRMAVQKTLNKRMKRIVTWHNSVFKSIAMMSSIQGAPLMYQVLFSSAAVCLMMYQIADKLDSGKVDIIFTVLLSTTMIQLWIPCYLGTVIRNKAFAVADAAWNCGWQDTSLGRLLRMDIVIVTMRAQQPLSIKFTGLPNLSLETFSSNMSSAYSYFNMLRQYN